MADIHCMIRSKQKGRIYSALFVFMPGGRLHAALHLQFDISAGLAATGQNFIFLYEGQRFGGVAHFTFQ